VEKWLLFAYFLSDTLFAESSDSGKWVWPFSVINKQFREVEKLLFLDQFKSNQILLMQKGQLALSQL